MVLTSNFRFKCVVQIVVEVRCYLIQAIKSIRTQLLLLFTLLIFKNYFLGVFGTRRPNLRKSFLWHYRVLLVILHLWLMLFRQHFLSCVQAYGHVLRYTIKRG